MKDDKHNRQQLACDYIHENYVAFNRLRYDLIAQKVQVLEDRWRYITNADINSIVCDCCAETGANITAKEILTVLNAGSSYIPRVHPLRDYVRSLKPYTPDQPDWIDMIAQQVTVKALGEEAKGKELWRACFKKWFVAMVASWLKDEVVNHQVLVLIGRQGIFKTTWLERLIPPHLRDYCCKLANATQLSKDDRLRIAEFGLINMDEFDRYSVRAMATLKNLMQLKRLNFRKSHRSYYSQLPRIASFIGTSNQKDLLTDHTGSRRFLCVEVMDKIDCTPPDYVQLYAQLKAELLNGERYWFSTEEEREIQAHNRLFYKSSPEQEIFFRCFRLPSGDEQGIQLSSTEIFCRLQKKFPAALRGCNVCNMGRMLVALGVERVRTRYGSSYRVVPG